jgi:hypothetical protein
MPPTGSHSKGLRPFETKEAKIITEKLFDFLATWAAHGKPLSSSFKIEKNQLINEWISMKLKDYMHKWNRDGRGGLNLPEFKDYYRKGGQLEINHYKINLFLIFLIIFFCSFYILRFSKHFSL